MAKSDRILALDIGASRITLAEFAIGKDGAVELLKYGIGSLGIEPDVEVDDSAFIVSAIRDLMREHDMRKAPLLMTVSGQAVFPRYVKLPPVSGDKIEQIINYEAEQNVPFPIDEVVWDYQLIGGGVGELNVMLVAVKTESVTRLTDCVLAAGLEPEIVDGAPMALYNTVRYNYPDLDSCTMVLDIGSRSSNLIFLEDTRIFSRSIPVAGNTISQELMKEFDVSFAEAEELKREHAFVAFGGVYAGPENDVANRVSKIVRNVVTRLHAEVNRSINFYRSQQGGSPPALVLLTGGSSQIPHMDTFFREKLKVEVETLNPFVNVAISDDVDLEQAGNDVFVLGEVVGLALRRGLTCPVEIDLMPPDLVSKKVMRGRIPFFVLSAMGLVCIILCWWAYVHRMRIEVGMRSEKVEQRHQTMKRIAGRLQTTIDTKDASRAKADQLVDVIQRRTRWIEIFRAVHDGMREGMWITSVEPVQTEPDAPITGVMVSGMGFVDKVTNTVEGTAVEVYRNNLISFDMFSDTSAIVSQPMVRSEDFARKFTIRLDLAQPIYKSGATEAEEGTL